MPDINRTLRQAPVLRPLVEGDLVALLPVQRAGAVAGLGHIFPQDVHPFPTHAVRDRWLDELADPDVDCFAIVHAGEIAGFAATMLDQLLHFGTAVQTWGSGLAGDAHDELLDHLRGRGLRSAWLHVFEENERAIRFYRRRGWVATDVTVPSTFRPHPTLRRYERILR